MRVVRVIIGILLVVAPLAALGAQTPQIHVPYTRFVLPNGLNVILHEDHATTTVSVNLWYDVGSAREQPGRTGFAHLFEHLMFEGSAHVPEGKFDEWLEAAGGSNNGSTNTDRTNYWSDVPANALELVLFLESDRMAHLLETMSPAKLDGQREVVKNERRQSVENRPYGAAWITLSQQLYEQTHPYYWPVIGSMTDLAAASHDDVKRFFKRYYAPGNATLAIAGHIDPGETRGLVEKWFGDVPAGAPVPPLDAPPPVLREERRVVLEDRVQLPRLYLAWHSPASLAPGDAEMDVVAHVLSGGKNSRLYKRLVYDLQIAQDVWALQSSARLSSRFVIIATARDGHTLSELERVIDAELDRLRETAPSEREVARAVHQFEATFLDRLERVGGFGGKADQLNAYFLETGNPDYFAEDLARYRALDPGDIQAAARAVLGAGRVVLSVVPQGETGLAATAAGGTK